MKFNRSAIFLVFSMVFVSILFAGQPCFAQGLTSALSGKKQSAPAEAATPADQLNRTSPRSSIVGFLEACHVGNFDKAAHYLDLRKLPRDRQRILGPELAKQLGQLLDRDSSFEVAKLSNAPNGNRFDGESPDLEALDTFESNGGQVMLNLQQITAKDGNKVWVVSSDSVAQIPHLFSLMGESPIERRLPTFLVTTQFLGAPLWVWLALILLAVVLAFLSKLLSRGILALLRPVQRRYFSSIHTHRMEDFVEPLRLILAAIVFRACMEVIAPSALLRLYLGRLVALLFFFAAASLAMRIVDAVSDGIASRFDARQRAVSYSVLSLTVRFIKICLFAIAVLFVLTSWGYNTTTILAGLGVGGIAIALASQKTIENLFGGISVIFDKPVLIGDFCNFGGQVGTIEDIGLRSTRIRTLDRTVVTIPNATFSTMTLENYSKRDRMWFHPTLRLRRGTSAEQVQQAMDAVTKILEDHPLVNPTDVPLRFTKITPESFDLEVFSYVLTADFNEYLRTQSELLLKIVATLSDLDIYFAVPVQEAFLSAHEHADGDEILKVLGAKNGMSGERKLTRNG